MSNTKSAFVHNEAELLEELKKLQINLEVLSYPNSYCLNETYYSCQEAKLEVTIYPFKEGYELVIEDWEGNFKTFHEHDLDLESLLSNVQACFLEYEAHLKEALLNEPFTVLTLTRRDLPERYQDKLTPEVMQQIIELIKEDLKNTSSLANSIKFLEDQIVKLLR